MTWSVCQSVICPVQPLQVQRHDSPPSSPAFSNLVLLAFYGGVMLRPQRSLSPACGTAQTPRMLRLIPASSDRGKVENNRQ
ncbi:hypothetical protein DTO212C5_2507 [Paecilomyces variotii]|nr:hypothetical protein DTO212C5_2507 [Paecilomyces variotii]